MDILYRGTIPEEKQYIATCDNCGTKVAYKLKEVEEVHDQCDGSYHWFKCPLCNREVYAVPQVMPEQLIRIGKVP